MSEVAGDGAAPAAPARSRWKRAALPAAFAALVVVQLAALFYFEPPGLLFSDVPASGRDLDTHIEQTWRFTEAFDGWGKTWSYDPHLLAGWPNGTIFDADNKGWELWTWAWTKLGVPRGVAFNLFLLLAHLAVPWVVFFSARLFGLRRGTALLAGALGLALWYADGFLHWAWWGGMTAYTVSAYACLLPVAFFFRYLADRRIRHAVGLAATLPLVHLLHPYAFFALAAPMLLLYVRAFRSLRPRDHAVAGIAVAATLAANAWWLIVAFRFWHYASDSGVLGAGEPKHLLTDWLGLVSDRDATGAAAMRSGFRFLALGAAALTLAFWRRDRDSRFSPLLAAVLPLLAVAYLGGLSDALRQVQPYRLILPALFFAVIPAAALLDEARLRGFARHSRELHVAVALLAVVAVPRLARDVLYFTPVLVPSVNPPAGARPKITDVTGFGTIGYPEHREYRREPPPRSHERITQLVKRLPPGGGRILVEDWVLGEHLAWRTDAEILGGFLMLNLQHAQANLFRRHPADAPDPEELRRYLEDYAVEWVVAGDAKNRYLAFGELLEPLFDVPPYRVFRSRLPVDFFAENSGTVRASLNRIDVRGTDPGRDVVLRYHWLETLVCRPGCRLLREPVLGDPVGFLRVPAPHPADFAIENGY